MKLRALVLAAAVCVLPLAAQEVPSPYGSFHALPHGYVDRHDTNLHLEFPLYNRSTVGGAQIAAHLVYDSLFWYPGTGGWTPYPGNGWRFVRTGGQLVEQESENYQACGWTDGDGTYLSYGSIFTADFYFTFPDGMSTCAGGYQTVTQPPPAHPYDYYNDCPDSTSLPITSTLGHGPDTYTFTIDSGGNGSVFDAAGDNVTNGYANPDGMSVTSSTAGGVTTYSDPLGQVLKVSGSATPGGSVTYQYPGPGGAWPTITESFQSYYAAAGFGCLTSFGGYLTLPSQLQYPNGDTYQFGYDSAGKLSSMTLPTGATVHYVHTFNDGGCSMSAALSRWDSVNGSGAAWNWATNTSLSSTVETSPAGDDTVFGFGFAASAVAVTSVDAYSGSHSGGTLLSHSSTSYSGGYSSPITATTVAELPGATPLYAQHVSSFDTFNANTETDDYDWSNSPTSPGPLLRKVVTNWQVSAGYADQSLSTTVSDASGQIGYSSRGFNGHGHVVQQSTYTGSRYLTSSATFNSNGTVATATDANGAVTNYGYSNGCGLFPSSIASASVAAVHSSATWDCTGAVLLTSTDANSQTTTYSYGDSNHTWRLTSVQTPDGALTNFSRTATSSESRMDFNGGNSTSDTVVTLDALGRPVLTQKRQGPTATQYDSVQTQYDTMGRPYMVSRPYSNTLGTYAGAYWTTTAFDALSRPISVTDGGGGYTQYAYNQNDVLITRGPGNLKRTQEEMDGLGRLRSVCEVTALGGSGACGQTTAANGFITSYARNGRGQITQVTQGPQTRSFAFDQAGRMTSETNPESGTTQYFFDSDGTCGTSSGDLVRRLDANGNTTCYSFDALHRTVQISYPSGPNAAATPTRTFVYDAATVAGVPMPYSAGRLAEAYTGARATDIGLGYDLMGRPSVVYETTPAMAGGWSQTGASYFQNGAVATLQLDSLTAGYTLDGEGRPLSASLGGTTLASGAAYDTSGHPTGVALGTAASDAYYYDATTGRMTEYKFTVGAGVDDGSLGWNSNGSLASLTISDTIAGTADSQTCTYGRDDMARLASVNCGAAWQQTFTLDSLGNLKKNPGSSQAFDAVYGANNRIASNGGVVPEYDADGNLESDPASGNSNTVNSFDAEGHAFYLEGIHVTYDALGRAAEAAEPSGAIEIVYGPGGGKLGIMGGGNLYRGEFPLPGGAEAVYSAATLQYFVHSDNLGSARLATTPSGGLYSSTAYAPYGETYKPTGTTTPSFTGQRQDIVGGQYDFLMRELSQVQGRWWTPDPAGLAAVDPNDPQTWNRYSYVGNTPLNAIDPLGLCHAVPGQNMVTDDQPGDCVQNGNSTVSSSSGPGGSVGSGALSGGFTYAPCITENNLGPGLSEKGSGSSATTDGPYDPGPAPDGCGYDRGTSGGYVTTPGWNWPYTPPTPRPTPAPPPPTPVKHTSFLDCVNHGADELNPANLIGLGNSQVAKGLLGGPVSAVTGYLGGGSFTSFASFASVVGLESAARSAEDLSADPQIRFYPAITTLTESPAITTWTLPLREIGSSVVSFFDKLDPVAFALDATVVRFVGVGCAAFN